MHLLPSLLLITAWLLVVPCSGAAPAHDPSRDVVVAPGSVQVGGVELRRGTAGYFSLAAARRALGPPTERWRVGLGITVYAWREFGFHLQRGWRGPERGRLFKLQVWLQDGYDRFDDHHSGSFRGHLHVDGLDLQAGQSLAGRRSDLERAGYRPSGGGVFKKNGIRILPSEVDGDQIARVEVWCEPGA